MTGVVKRLNKEKGFGFIKAGTRDYFFHRSACQNIEFEELTEGRSVTFEPTESTKGPRAEDVNA
jgi:cold shock CspA family protein